MKIPKNKIDFRYNLKIYFELIKQYKIYVAAILIAILVIESSKVFRQYLFKLVIDNTTSFIASEISKNQIIQILSTIGIAFAIAIIAQATLRFLYNQWIAHLEVNIMRDVKKKFFDHLIILSYDFHTSTRTGSLISRLVRSGGAVERLTDTLLYNLLPLAIQLATVTVTISYIDITSSMVILITFAVFVTTSLITNKIQEGPNLAANDAEDYEKGHIADMFTNVESIKLFGKENIVKSNYQKVGEETKTAQFNHWRIYNFQSSANTLVLGTGTFLLVYFPLMSALDGKISVGTLVFIYTTYSTLLDSFFGFDRSVRDYYRSMADFESLFQFGKIENSIRDQNRAKELNIGKGEVEFSNVTFRYKKNAIFKKFNLKIKHNQKVALVGPSGAGKTSLVRLLYRLYDVENGTIKIDGQNIRKFRQESLRSELSIVPQECVLFDDTVYNNIAFSRPTATREEVMQAMKFAQLDKIVAKFPQKENTIVGERGIKLSGGEKQRVSIARAILADKKILVLDEATSSLDSHTESEIQKDLQKLMKGRTSIIIAHRLSTIMSADMIVVIDEGKVVQKGTHKELIKKEGTYKKLWSLQKGGYIE